MVIDVNSDTVIIMSKHNEQAIISEKKSPLSNPNIYLAKSSNVNMWRTLNV